MLRAPELSHGSLFGIADALALEHSGLIGQETAGLAAQLHIREGELGILELADGLAELDAALGIIDGLFHCALGNPQGLGSDADPAAVQGLHGDGEAAAFFAQQVLLGHDAVGEDDLGGGGTMEAHLDLVLAHGEAGEAALDNKGGDALGALALVGHGEDHKHISNIAIGDEDLGAVHHIVIAHQLGLGLALGGVGTGVGLGEGKRADFMSSGQHGQVLCLLLLGAVGEDGVAAKAVMGGDNVTGGSTLLAQLLDADGAGKGVRAGAAVLGRHAHTHDAQVKELLDVLTGIFAVQVGFGGDRLHLIFGELRHHLPDQLMLAAQIKIHDVLSLIIYLEKCAKRYRLQKLRLESDTRQVYVNQKSGLFRLRFHLPCRSPTLSRGRERIDIYWMAGHILGKLLLALDVSLTCNHDALSLGRACAVHGLGTVAHSRRAKAHILQEPHDALTVFRGNAFPGRKELVADIADGLAVPSNHRVTVEVLLRGHGDHQAARDVLCKTHDLIGEAGDVLLADVGKEQINLIVARLGLEALGRAGDAAAEQGFVQWVISISLSFTAEAFSTPLYSAARAAAPITTSPTPTLQPP